MITQKIKAVFDSELAKVLSDLKLIDKINNGEVKCFLCGDKITLESLQYIVPKNKKIVISCNKANCIIKIENDIKT